MQLQNQLGELADRQEASWSVVRLKANDCMLDRELIVAMVKVTGAFQKSSEIMKATSQLIKLPQFSATMREMSMEMMKVCLSLPFSHTSYRMA
jgi:charged multivesicular body protein 3